jgi:hypothetical protein
MDCILTSVFQAQEVKTWSCRNHQDIRGSHMWAAEGGVKDLPRVKVRIKGAPSPNHAGPKPQPAPSINYGKT